MTDHHIEALARRMRELKAAGRWQVGPSSLVELLGLHHDEVRMVRLLAWLSTPGGRHGLGDAFLAGLLRHFGADYVPGSSVDIRIEAVEFDTRADLTIHAGQIFLLIEAKINAREQPGQCDRLAARWRHRDPKLVFLTLDGRAPGTADVSSKQWSCCSWSQVAEVLAVAINAASHPAPAARDILTAFRTLPGPLQEMTMTSDDSDDGNRVFDDKDALFVGHWREIVEWSGLKSDFARRLDVALRHATDTHVDVARSDGRIRVAKRDTADGGSTHPRIQVAFPHWSRNEGTDGICVALGWTTKQLFVYGAEALPYIGVYCYGSDDFCDDVGALLPQRLRDEIDRLDWMRTEPPWLCYRYIEPFPDRIAPAAYADACVQELTKAWQAVSVPLDAFWRVFDDGQESISVTTADLDGLPPGPVAGEVE
jgi:hypothetical protein